MRRIPVRVVDSECASDAGIADLVLVFTKTGATIAALEDARPVIGDATRLVSVQNGLGNADALAGFVPMARVIYGTTMAPGDIIAPVLSARMARMSHSSVPQVKMRRRQPWPRLLRRC